MSLRSNGKSFFLKSSRTNNCQVNDRANIYDIADNQYHWVARPKQLNDIHDLNIPHILSVKPPISGRFAQILKMQQEWNLIDLINKSKRVSKLVR